MKANKITPAPSKTLRSVLAIGFGCWGCGSSSADAANRWAKEVGPSRLLTYKEDVTVEFRAVPMDFEMDGLFNLSAARIEKLPSVKLSLEQRRLIWGGVELLDEVLSPVADAVFDLENCEVGS